MHINYSIDNSIRLNFSNVKSSQRDRIDWLSPKPIFIAIVLLGVIMPTSSFLNYDDSFSMVWPFDFFSKNETVFKAVAIYAGVTLAFLVGYRFAKTRTVFANNLKIDDNNFINRAIAMASLGFVTFFVIIYSIGGFSEILTGASDRTRAFAGLQGLFLVLNVLISVSIVWFIRIFNSKRTLFEKISFFFYTIFSLGIIALQGQKSTLFIMIAAMAVIYNCKFKKIRLQAILLGVSSLFILLMAYHIYKQEYLVLGRVVSISGGAQFWGSVYDFLNSQIFGNFMQLQTMAVLIEGMPLPLSYQYGYTYWAGLLMLVPRSIFPDKPLPSTGIFTEAFWPAAWRELGTTLPPGLFGEAYMNFGVAGAIAGGLLFGYILGRLHANFQQNKNGDMVLVYYAVLVASILHFFRGELASVTYLVLSIALPCRLFMSNLKTGARS
jgi:oligosaccharide repeat unit polymerase